MYEVNEEVKEEIIAYCGKLISRMNKEYLKKNRVYSNEFLESLYYNCHTLYEETGKYELTDSYISILFTVKKQSEQYLSKIKEGLIKVKGIDKNDNLIIIE